MREKAPSAFWLDASSAPPLPSVQPAIGTAIAGEILASQHAGCGYFLVRGLEALDLVHRRAEGREGEPVGKPDIAEHHVADVQADAKVDVAQVLLRSFCADLRSAMRAVGLGASAASAALQAIFDGERGAFRLG